MIHVSIWNNPIKVTFAKVDLYGTICNICLAYNSDGGARVLLSACISLPLFLKQ